MSLIGKIWKRKSDLRSIFSSIYFNFKYLPFKQAIKLPILLYKPHFIALKGKVTINSPSIRTGMIRLGFHSVSVYPNNGITLELQGKEIIFKGKCNIGNDSYISTGGKSIVEFGEDFFCSAGLKLVSYRGIKFGKRTSFGWNCLVMDTNFHPLYDITKKKYKKASGKIEIGDNNWFATQCKIMHSVTTPERCIFGMGTTITRNSEMKSYCVMGGSPVKILTENVMRDYDHDTETYD